MRLSKTAYYADFVIYAVVIAGLLLAAAFDVQPMARLKWLTAFAAGAALWTLLEYLLHRFVLHRVPLIAPLHDLHHTWPRALIGTPTWATLAIIWATFFLPVWREYSFNVASGLTAGVMAGFLWYGILHHVIHHRRPRTLFVSLTACRRRHLRHHYGDRAANFGVTTALWDHLFGTADESLWPVAQRGRRR